MDSTDTTSFTGRFYRRVYAGENSFSIDLVATSDRMNLPPGIRMVRGKALVSVSGNGLPEMDHVPLRYHGRWTEGSRGLLFRCETCAIETPKTEKGLVSFLSSELFPGIGRKTAERIIRRFGKDTLRVLEMSPQDLLAVKGISKEKLARIVEAYRHAQAYQRLASFLGNFGVPMGTIMRISEQLGSSAVEEIKASPYSVMGIRGVGFRTCDRIARGMGAALDSVERITGSVKECLESTCQMRGDMYMDLPELREMSLKLLNEGFQAPPVSPARFDEVLEGMHPETVVIRSRKYVFLRNYDDAESLSARKLAAMIKSPVPYGNRVDEALEKYSAASEIRLSEKQKEAVRTSLQNRVSVITGGPGTGKTTIIKAVISVYQALTQSEVTCMAPTGKAARRMSEATGHEASTIHSRLELFDTSVSHRVRPIERGLVIVDEMSMVDGLLFRSLMEAVSPECSLLFVGDVNQLQSVGPGAVLRELIESGVLPVTTLTEIFRQKDGSTIIENAVKINAGQTDLVYDDSFLLLPVASEAEAVELVKKAYRKACGQYGIEHVALLSPLRKTQNGRFTCVADALNPLLQDEVNPETDIISSARIGDTVFRTGDRVLEWKNTEEASNGDTGYITRIWEDEEDYGLTVGIAWDNGRTAQYHRHDMESITLAYAMSVHKSQGSEYDAVIIPVLSEQHCRIMRRNLLYTAVTRAKKKVILIGDRKEIVQCIMNRDEHKRKTLLSHRLRYNMGSK